MDCSIFVYILRPTLCNNKHVIVMRCCKTAVKYYLFFSVLIILEIKCGPQYCVIKQKLVYITSKDRQGENEKT